MTRATGWQSTTGRAGMWFCLPAIVWILALTLFPLGYSFTRSFQTSTRNPDTRKLERHWAGLTQYRRALSNPDYKTSMVFTSTVAVSSVVLQLAAGYGLALLAMGPVGRGGRAVRSILVAPSFVAPVAVGYLALTFFAEREGLINLILSGMTGTDAGPAWRSSEAWATVAVIVVDAWQWTPFCFLIFSAALAGVPDEVLEAAALEGADRWAIIRRVLIPLTLPAVLTVGLLRLVEALKIFDVPYVLTRGGPGTATYTYTHWIWRTALRDGNYELAAALSFLLLVPVVLTATLLIRLVRRRAA